MALTLRLDPDEKKALDQISHFLDEKTATGTLNAMIKNYMPMQEQLDRTKLALNQVTNSHQRLCRSLRNVEEQKSLIHALINE